MEREEKQERIRESVRRLYAAVQNAHESHDKGVFELIFRKIDELSAKYEVCL